ncbi:MAG: alanine dehydrogenase [Saprospiraceae bacterium]|nr:alanine dehydrogenase [Saprospiraceae bacterium]
MKIGIIREGKVPPDARVPFAPSQCAFIMKIFPIEIVVEPSQVRCYKDGEYEAAGIQLTNAMGNCDLLMGIKEVPLDQLIPDKTYLFFSHTIKAQPNNRKLLQAILKKNIRLIDYEALTDEHGNRLIAFGRFAGMVGAHNALWTYGQRTGAFKLARLKDHFDYAEAQMNYKAVKFPPIKIVVTGSGRVASGAVEVLRDMGIQQVSPDDFLNNIYNEAVFTQLSSKHYVTKIDGKPFDYNDFYNHPQRYKSTFEPYFKVADIFINGIYWNPNSPAFFTKEDMRRHDFNIKVIGDVTCDLAPRSSVPATIRASTIADPVFGYNPFTETETAPHQPGVIDMMTIDNLPSELPRDASYAFGEKFIQDVLPELLTEDSPVIKRATVTENGKLTDYFKYLQNYVDEY